MYVCMYIQYMKAIGFLVICIVSALILLCKRHRWCNWKRWKRLACWQVGGLTTCRLAAFCCVDMCRQFYSWLVHKMSLYIFTVMFTHINNKWLLKSNRKWMGNNGKLLCCTTCVCMYLYMNIDVYNSMTQTLHIQAYI